MTPYREGRSLGQIVDDLIEDGVPYPEIAEIVRDHYIPRAVLLREITQEEERS